MFKVNNRNTRTRCETCSELTIKIPERRRRCSGIFIVNFKHISRLVLVFLLLTWVGKCRLGLHVCFGRFLWLLVQMGYNKPRYEPLWATLNHYEPLLATMSHYESLWPKILTLRRTMTQLSIEYNVMTQNKTKEVLSPISFLSQKYLIWSQNLKMLCLKRNLALVCIRGCWLRMW